MSVSKIIGAPVPPEQAAIIDLLKEALAQALEGHITTVAVIAVFDDGIGTIMAGRNASALNLACDELKAKILDAATESGSKVKVMQ